MAQLENITAGDTKKKTAKGGNRWLTIMGFALVALGVVGLMRFLPARPLENVQVHSKFSQVQADQLHAMIQPHFGEDLFSINLQQVQQKINALDWVKTSELRRVWPDTLKLHVEERVPVAMWQGNDGNLGVVTADGHIVFDSEYSNDALPNFIGSADSVDELIAAYELLTKELVAYADTIDMVQKSAFGSWSADVNGSPVHFGREISKDRINRLVATYEKSLRSRWADVAYIDLRYSSGVAVGWNQQ